jgi:hypothetical protein
VEDNLETCCDCNEKYPSDDIGWSHSQEAPLCRLCEESDMQYASTLQIITLNGVRLYHIGKHIRMTEYGDDLAYDDTIDPEWVSHSWVSTSAWRGYTETKLKGWETIMDGWTTGGWDDATARRKQRFNQWCQDLCDMNIIVPCPVALIADRTSNVFSTAVTVAVKTEDVELFKEWLDSDYEELQEALK